MSKGQRRKSTGSSGSRPADSPVPINYHRPALILLVLLPLVFYLEYLFGGRMLFGTDWLGAGGYSMRLFMTEYIRSNGNVAFWMPALYSGQPTLAAFFGDLFYPTQLFRLFIPVHVVWSWTFYAHVVVAGIGSYLFLRELKLPALPAALGGVAYMFAGSLLTLTYAGHDGRLIGSALLPLALFFLHRAMTRRQLFWFLLMGLVLALQLLSGHVQKVYYTGLMLFAYFLFQWVRIVRDERSAGMAVRLWLYFIVGAGFSVTLSAIQYLPIFGNMPFAARGAERGYEYAVSWSMPIRETLDLLSPRFSGILNEYRGSNPFKLHSEYMGLLPLLLALVAVVRGWRNRAVKFFLFALLVSLLMAWGGNTPFYRLPYLLLPGISMFRGPSMIFFLVSFSIAALAGFGFKELFDRFGRRRGHRPAGALILAGVVAGVMTLDVGLSLRLWDEDRGYIRSVPPPSDYFAPDEAIAFLRQDTTLHRVLPLNYERSDEGILMQYGIHSVGGQMPNPLQNYQDFIGAEQSVMFRPENLVHGNFTSLLNVKYVLISYGRGVSRPSAEEVAMLTGQLNEHLGRRDVRPAMVGNRYGVFQLDSTLPRAFIAEDYLVVDGFDDVRRRLMSTEFDPGRTVLLYEDPKLVTDSGLPVRDHTQTGPAGTAEVVLFDPNRIEVKARLDRPGLLVLSENHHPNWQAEVNGEAVETLRAYHTLRAVPLSAGEHSVVFRYSSRWYRLGAALSFGSLGLLALVAMLYFARQGFQTRNNKRDNKARAGEYDA